MAAGILTFRVLRKFFPYWQDLLSRLERIFSLGGSNRAAKMSVAVREACEVFLSTATGTNVSIGALALPSDKRGPTVVENVRVDNPGGFRAGKAALAIGRMEVQARMHLPPEAFSSRTLTLLDVDTVAITDMAVRVEVASLKNLFSGEAKTNLEAITKHLDHNKKKARPPRAPPRAFHGPHAHRRVTQLRRLFGRRWTRWCRARAARWWCASCAWRAAPSTSRPPTPMRPSTSRSRPAPRTAAPPRRRAAAPPLCGVR